MKTKSQVKKQSDIFSEKSKHTQNYVLENFRRSYLKRILYWLKIPGSGNYLDIGCGALGHLIIESGRLGQKGTGLELTRDFVDKAKKFAAKELGKKNNCQFVVGVAEKLPFPDQKFTKLSAVAVLEHIEDDEKVLSEISRVVKPGGRIFLTIPNSFDKIFLPFRWYYKKVDREMGHLRHYDGKELIERLKQYGFKTVSLNYTGHLPKVIQYLISIINPKFNSSNWWWKLEEIDHKMKNVKSGLHFDLIMEKKT